MPRQLCITTKLETVQTVSCSYLEPQIRSAFVTCCKHDGIKFATIPTFELNFVSSDLRYPLEHLAERRHGILHHTFGKKFIVNSTTLTGRTYLKRIVPLP